VLTDGGLIHGFPLDGSQREIPQAVRDPPPIAIRPCFSQRLLPELPGIVDLSHSPGTHAPVTVQRNHQ